MKLVNAKLYEEQIKRKMWEIWYDEKYQYYFGVAGATIFLSQTITVTTRNVHLLY